VAGAGQVWRRGEEKSRGFHGGTPIREAGAQGATRNGAEGSARNGGLPNQARAAPRGARFSLVGGCASRAPAVAWVKKSAGGICLPSPSNREVRSSRIHAACGRPAKESANVHKRKPPPPSDPPPCDEEIRCRSPEPAGSAVSRTAMKPTK